MQSILLTSKMLSHLYNLAVSLEGLSHPCVTLIIHAAHFFIPPAASCGPRISAEEEES